MKDKIMYLILGILIGAVITAGCFLIFQKKLESQRPDGFRGNMDFSGERPSDEEFEEMVKNGEIPERPNGDSKRLDKESRQQDSTSAAN